VLGGERGEVKDEQRLGRLIKWLLGLGVALVVLGSIYCAFTTFGGGLSISRVSFPNTYSAGRQKVAGLVYMPTRAHPGKLPAVVFAHGFSVNKELYLPLCRELARDGFAVLAIDLPGHGRSGGHTDVGGSEYTAMLAARDWLVSKYPAVDPDRIAAMGHSLGGVSSVRAGLFQKTKKFHAIVAVFCWEGVRQTLDLVYHPGIQAVRKQWPLMVTSRYFDINDPRQVADRDIISKLTTTSPPNFLLVSSTGDEMCSSEQDRQLMARAAGVKSCQPGDVYGSFKDGSARMLVFTDEEHVMEALSTRVVGAAYDWLGKAFGIQTEHISPFLLFRYNGWGGIITGAFMLSIAVALLLMPVISRRRKVPPGAWATDRALMGMGNRGRTAFVGWFLVASLVAFPVAKLVGIEAVVPFFAGDLVSSLAIVRSLLLLGALVLAMRMATGDFSFIRKLDWKLGARDEAFQAVTPVAGFVAFLFVYAPLSRVFYLGPSTPYSWIWYLLAVVIVGSAFWLEGRYFHLFLLPMFGSLEGRKRLGYVATEGSIRALGTAVAVLPLLSSPFQFVGRAGSVRMPVFVLVLVIGLVMFFVVAWLNLKTREKAASLVVPSLFIALFQAWVLTALISAR
jgi:pimeloyl-ACP methyl ester carboxylesterase